jgi:hypothetical protein
MNQEAACASHNPEWDPDSVSAILIQSQQSRDAQLLLEINFRIKSYEPIWHPENPKWISRRQRYDIQKGDDRTGFKTKPYCKQSPYRKCCEEAPKCTCRQRIAAGDYSMSVPWKRSLAESTSTPGEGAESIPGGKPETNWR